jgi:hypothetical protein
MEPRTANPALFRSIRPCMTFAPDNWKTSANRGMPNGEGRGGGKRRGRVYTKDKETRAERGGVASIQKTKKLVFCPTTKRLETFGTMRAEFPLCGIGSDARGFLCNKGAVISEALVPFGQARPFQGGCDRSGGVE